MIKKANPMDHPKSRPARYGWMSAVLLSFFVLGFSQTHAQAAPLVAWKPAAQSQASLTEIGFKFGFRSGGFRSFGKFGGHRFGKFRGSRFNRFRGRGFNRFGRFRGNRFGGFRNRGFRRFR